MAPPFLLATFCHKTLLFAARMVAAIKKSDRTAVDFDQRSA
jgi:hypothetical protein